MEVGLNGRPTKCIANTLQLRHVAMVTISWLSVGYNFDAIARDALFDSWGECSVVKLSYEDIAEIEVLMDVAMATIFGFVYMGCRLAPPGEYD